MIKYNIKFLLASSLLAFFSTISAALPVQQDKASKIRGRNELTLHKSTVKGDVIKAMKIDLINLKKNRRERLERQLKNQIIIRKHFFQERIQDKAGDQDRKVDHSALSAD